MFLKLIETRDKYAADLRHAAPEDMAAMRRTLAKMDEKLEECESKLAVDLENYQKRRRREEEIDKRYDETMRKMEIRFVYYKHRLFDRLDMVSAPIFRTFKNDEEIESFFDRTAILEATRLDEILSVDLSELILENE